MKKKHFAVFLLLLFCLGLSSANAQFSVDLESGFFTTAYNDVRIPGDQGTLFSFKDDLKSKSELFYRLQLHYTHKSRHTFSLLYAPLQTRSEGSVANDIVFQGVVFPANTMITGTYKFNSYRLTYRYDIVKKPRFEFGLGFTAKIRDANIALSSYGLTAEKINVGFVPIINFRISWNIYEKVALLLMGDALAAPQGRAEDVLVAVTFRVHNNLTIRTGYRLLEGGADNDEVYTFSMFHYALVGIAYRFKKIEESLN